MDYSIILNLIVKGDLDNAMNLLSEIKDLRKFNIDEIIEYYNLLHSIYALKGDYQSAIETNDKLITLAELIKDENLLLDIIIQKCNILWKWYKLSDLLKLVEDAELLLFKRQDISSMENIRYFSLLKHLKGGYFRFSSELDVALAYFEESYIQAKNLEDTKLHSLCLNAIGLIHLDIGNYSDAKYYLEKSLTLREKEYNKLPLATTYLNLGRFHENIGDINKALEYFNKMNKIGINRSCIRTQGLANNALGLLYNKLNEPDTAYKYLNEAFFNFQVLDNDYYLAKIIFDIINVFSFDGKIDVIQPFLHHIDEINKNNDSKIIKLYYELSWASYNRLGVRMRDRAAAQTIFFKIANDEIIEYSLFVYAALNLTHMLFTELKFTTNKEVLEELYDIMKLLRFEHIHSDSHILLLESFILESKLARLEFNINYAYELLNNAYEIAVEKKLKGMILKISSEFDDLLTEYQVVSNDVISTETLFERIQDAEIEDYIADLVQSRVKSFDLVTEKPLLLLIVDDENTYLSKILDPQSSIDNYFITSILSTIDLFMGEVLKRKEEKLERLKHGDNYLLIKKINHFRIIYCFESKASFAGVERFNKLMKDEIFINLIANFSDVAGLAASQSIIDVVEKIF